MKATGSFTPTKWDEQTTTQITPVKKITKTSAELSFAGGEIAGTATVEWLMFYRFDDEKEMNNSSAEYVGIIRFEGSLHGKSGSFVMEDRGTVDQGSLSAHLNVLADSSSGELLGIVGAASYHAAPQGTVFEIEYQLP